MVERLGGRDRFEIAALTGNGNIPLLAEQARRIGAELAVTADEDRYGELKDALSGSGIEVAAGRSGLIEAAERHAGWVMAAIVGNAGLGPTLAAARRGADIALANKECLVSAGSLFIDAVAEARRTCCSSHLFGGSGRDTMKAPQVNMIPAIASKAIAGGSNATHKYTSAKLMSKIAVILARREIAPSSRQSRNGGPNNGWSISHFARRGEECENNHTARRRKGVVGSSGRKIPAMPSPTITQARLRSARRMERFICLISGQLPNAGDACSRRDENKARIGGASFLNIQEWRGKSASLL